MHFNRFLITFLLLSTLQTLALAASPDAGTAQARQAAGDRNEAAKTTPPAEDSRDVAEVPTANLTNTASGGKDASPVGDCPSVKQLQQVLVTKVVKLKSLEPNAANAAIQGSSTSESPTVKLTDAIGITVANLGTLLRQEGCSPVHKKIVLFLDKRPLADLTPYPRSDPAQNTLYFQLQRSETSRDVWTYLLGKPSLKLRPVQVSVGFEDGYALPTVGTAVQLETLPIFWFFVWLVLFAVLVWLVCWLGSSKDMLRDVGVAPGDARMPYSLGRVQLAFWTILVIGGYLLIGLTTGDYSSSITDSVLGLLGISAGTTIGASLLDSPSDGAAAIPAQPSVAPRSTGHWYLDILSDGNGVNFHRYQMFAWTLILGVVYVHQVYRDLAMPDFSATLLALMGISSGTYLGLKATTESRVSNLRSTSTQGDDDTKRGPQGSGGKGDSDASNQGVSTKKDLKVNDQANNTKDNSKVDKRADNVKNGSNVDSHADDVKNDSDIGGEADITKANSKVSN